MIVIVDYGTGNLGSVENMFKKIGVKAIISSDLNLISKCIKLVLPGVGSFDSAMKKISSSGLLNILNNKAIIEKVPVLAGIISIPNPELNPQDQSLKNLWLSTYCPWYFTLKAADVRLDFSSATAPTPTTSPWTSLNPKP